MREISVPRLIVGGVLWVALILVAAGTVMAPDGAARVPAERLLRFAGENPRSLSIVLPPQTNVRIGDPVLVPHPTDFLLQVGRVVRVETGPDEVVARIQVHPEHSALLEEGLRAECFTVPSSASWIIATLLPAERRGEIRGMAEKFLAEHGEALRETLWPELRAGILDVLGHVERELPIALAARSERWDAFFRRHRDGVLRETLLPVLQEVTLELAREKFEPWMNDVGGELWDSLPAWSLGWRYVWQKVPLTAAGQARARFDRYLEEDAAPILAAHAEEAAGLAGEVVRDSLRNERVQEALSASLRTLAADPELAELARGIMNDVFLRNEALGQVVRQRWEGGLREAVASAVNRIEPLFEDAVNSVILDADRDRISPRLSRVLRCRVLMKDGRWLLLEGGNGAALPDGARVAGSIRDD